MATVVVDFDGDAHAVEIEMIGQPLVVRLIQKLGDSTRNRVTLQLQKRNKTANINVKNWFIHELTAHDTPKTAKITKR